MPRDTADSYMISFDLFYRDLAEISNNIRGYVLGWIMYFIDQLFLNRLRRD